MENGRKVSTRLASILDFAVLFSLPFDIAEAYKNVIRKIMLLKWSFIASTFLQKCTEYVIAWNISCCLWLLAQITSVVGHCDIALSLY